MAGTLTISTLSDGTNSTSATNCIQGSAKAWVTYDSVSKVIRASYNVSSVTYVATGSFVINYTNAFSDAYYSPQVRAFGATNGAWGIGGVSLPTTTSWAFYTQQYNTSNTDYPYICVAIFR